jgi:hypothetical protein
MLTQLAMAPPNGAPLYISVTLALRRFSGLLSAVSAIRMGSAPPRPKPVSRRAALSEAISNASGVNRENRPNKAIDATRTLLRPMRSARRPPMRAPKNRPKVLALKKFPSCAGLALNFAAIPEAATPAACRSMPSHSAASTQKMTVVRATALFSAPLSIGITCNSSANRGYATRCPRP